MFHFPIITKNFTDVNINLSNGKLIGIYGESGSGKSTLLNLICGLLDPTIGEISYNKKIF